MKAKVREIKRYFLSLTVKHILACITISCTAYSISTSALSISCTAKSIFSPPIKILAVKPASLVAFSAMTARTRTS